MLTKKTLLLAALVPALALVACKRKDTDDNAPAAAATATPPAAATVAPADTGAMPPASTAAAPAAASTSSMPAGMAMGSAPAAETPFADLDKNHDGSLTKDELPADDMLAQHFSVADANGDGKLSEAEATKHRADMAAKP